MGLTVNLQTVKKVAVKGLEYLLSRTIIASNNGVKCTGTFHFILLHFN